MDRQCPTCGGFLALKRGQDSGGAIWFWGCGSKGTHCQYRRQATLAEIKEMIAAAKGKDAGDDTPSTMDTPKPEKEADRTQNEIKPDAGEVTHTKDAAPMMELCECGSAFVPKEGKNNVLVCSGCNVEQVLSAEEFERWRATRSRTAQPMRVMVLGKYRDL